MVQNSNVTPVSAWKETATHTELPLPSGKVCLVRGLDLAELVRGGSIPNDLLPIIQKAMDDSKGKPEALRRKEMEQAVESDPKMLSQVFEMMDLVVMAVVVQPLINPRPENEADRSAELLYVDEVLTDDKLFIMNWAMGGTSNLEQFRRELEGEVASAPAGSGVRRPAKRPAGSRKR